MMSIVKLGSNVDAPMRTCPRHPCPMHREDTWTVLSWDPNRRRSRRNGSQMEEAWWTSECSLDGGLGQCDYVQEITSVQASDVGYVRFRSHTVRNRPDRGSSFLCQCTRAFLLLRDGMYAHGENLLDFVLSTGPLGGKKGWIPFRIPFGSESGILFRPRWSGGAIVSNFGRPSRKEDRVRNGIRERCAWDLGYLC